MTHHNSRSLGYYLIALFVVWSSIGFFHIVLGLWLLAAVLLTTPVILLLLAPPSVLRPLGQAARYVKRMVERPRQQSRAGTYERKRFYEQGYQATTSNIAQEASTAQELPDPYEVPQALYPQPQPPM